MISIGCSCSFPFCLKEVLFGNNWMMNGGMVCRENGKFSLHLLILFWSHGKIAYTYHFVHNGNTKKGKSTSLNPPERKTIAKFWNGIAMLKGFLGCKVVRSPWSCCRERICFISVLCVFTCFGKERIFQ